MTKVAGPAGAVGAHGYPDGTMALHTASKIHLTLNGGTND
jgi:hypothetical protein